MPLPDNVVAEFTGTSGTEYYIYQIPDDIEIGQATTNIESNYGLILNSSYLTGTLPTEVNELSELGNELPSEKKGSVNNVTYDGQNLGSLLFNIVTNSRTNTEDYNFFYNTDYNLIEFFLILNDGRGTNMSLQYDNNITNPNHVLFQNNPNVDTTSNSLNNSANLAIIGPAINYYQLLTSLTNKPSDNFNTIDTHTYHYKNVGLYIVEKTSSGYTIGSSSSSISYGTYTSPVICFPKNTPVTTDQGDVPIQDLENKPYTIQGNKVLGTVSMNSNEPMVYFKQHSLAYNVPNKNTYITQSHVIYHNNTQLKAIDYTKKDFHKRLCINNLKGIKQEKPIVVKVENNKVYNVVLESGHKMKVNNMLVETLHPSNNLYKQKLLK